MKTPDLYGEITPAIGAAGFKIGSSIELVQGVSDISSRWDKNLMQIQQAISSAEEWLIIPDSELSNFSKLDGQSYYYRRGSVKLHYTGQGILDYIEVSQDYLGSLYGSIKIGDELRTVQKYFDIEYDSAEEIHIPINCRENGLISFYAEEQGLVDSPYQHILSIFVHDYK